MRKKRLWPKRTYYSRNWLKGLRKTTKNLRVGPQVKVRIQDLAQKTGLCKPLHGGYKSKYSLDRFGS